MRARASLSEDDPPETANACVTCACLVGLAASAASPFLHLPGIQPNAEGTVALRLRHGGQDKAPRREFTALRAFALCRFGADRSENRRGLMLPQMPSGAGHWVSARRQSRCGNPSFFLSRRWPDPPANVLRRIAPPCIRLFIMPANNDSDERRIQSDHATV